MTIAIVAAGTGGHVLPALAVAAALEGMGVDRGRIRFLGGDRFEASAVPAAGYGFVGFEMTRLHRRLTAQNLRIPFVVRRTSRAMAAELERSEARVVLGMVGYATVPAALAAGRAGVPLVVHEQNALPGLAARFAARRARVTLLGLPGPASRLARSQLVGNPLRPEFATFDRRARRAAARSRYGLPATGPVVGILGGSQGAKVLNAAAPAVATAAGCALLHITGPEAHGVEAGAAPSLPWVRMPFETSMTDFFAAVDLVVCRAGAMTVSEVAATATPAVFVPLERVGQTANARVLADVGGARIVSQDSIASLPAVVAGLVTDPATLQAMGTAAAAQAHPAAAARVAARVLEVAGG